MVSLSNTETETMDRIERLSDDDDDTQTSGSEAYEEGDLLASAMDDDVTAQLAAAGWQIKSEGDFHFFAFSPFDFFNKTKSFENIIFLQIKTKTFTFLFLIQQLISNFLFKKQNNSHIKLL